MEKSEPKKVLIIGAGFGGIAAARALGDSVKIVLVSDKPHFEYHAALYRVVTGRSPLEVCIPVAEILKKSPVEFVVDSITEINLEEKTAHGASGSRYTADYLIFGLGSETAYFDIPGLKEFSYGFKSIPEAIRLKQHIHKEFETCTISDTDQEEDLCRMHFVVVGAGASGVELAGELACYTKKLAHEHGVNASLITIDLIEAAPRILPALPERVSKRVADRLRELGINIFVNRSMVREEAEQIMVRGLSMKTETVIWTAGIKPNAFLKKTKGLEFDNKGRVVVDDYLCAKGFENVYIVGDGAATLYSGMAQTAIHDGEAAALNIMRSVKNLPPEKYQPKRPYYSIPVGPGWAATLAGPFTLYGRVGWMLRRFADMRYFLSILPLSKALDVFRSGKTICESCAICLPDEH